MRLRALSKDGIKHLGPTGLRVLLFLAGRHYKPGQRVEIAYMAKCVKRTTRQVEYSLARLRQAGVLKLRYNTRPVPKSTGCEFRMTTYIHTLAAYIQPPKSMVDVQNWHNHSTEDFEVYVEPTCYASSYENWRAPGRPSKASKMRAVSPFTSKTLEVTKDFSFCRNYFGRNRTLSYIVVKRNGRQCKYLREIPLKNPIGFSRDSLLDLPGGKKRKLLDSCPLPGVVSEMKVIEGVNMLVPGEREGFDIEAVESRIENYFQLGASRPPPKTPYDPDSVTLPPIQTVHWNLFGGEIKPGTDDELIEQAAKWIRHAWRLKYPASKFGIYFFTGYEARQKKQLRTLLLNFAKECMEWNILPAMWVRWRCSEIFRLKTKGYFSFWKEGTPPPLKLMLAHKKMRIPKWRRQSRNFTSTIWQPVDNKELKSIQKEQYCRWVEVYNVRGGRDLFRGLPDSYVRARKIEMKSGHTTPDSFYPLQPKGYDDGDVYFLAEARVGC